MFALVFIYSTSLLFHLTLLEQSVTSTLQLFTNCLVWKHFSINTFNSFIRIFLRDKQNNPRGKKFEVVQAMRLSCCCFLNRHLFMLTVSVTCPYFGGFIYTYRDIIFLKLRFFSPFLSCLPFTHKRRFCATKTLVLGLVHTYSNIFEKEKFISLWKKKERNTLHVAYFNRFCRSVKTLHIFKLLSRKTLQHQWEWSGHRIHLHKIDRNNQMHSTQGGGSRRNHN